MELRWSEYMVGLLENWRARIDAAAMAYASPCKIPVEGLGGREAVNALLFATMAKVVDFCIVEVSVANEREGVVFGKAVD